MQLSFGGRVFAPSWLMTLLTVGLCAAFVALGRWQWDRGVRRQAEWDAFARGADRALRLDADTSGVARFQKVEASGRYDGAHQFLLDNRTHDGQAGYEVLTPLVRAAGPPVLVDRGWVAFTGYRSRLPDVSLDASAPLTVTGRLDELPSAGLASGRMAPDASASWPKVTSYPRMSELARAYGQPLAPRIILLDPGASFGYVRVWQPPGLSPVRHWSYAVQWWGFALTVLVLWAIFATQKRAPGPHTPALTPRQPPA